MDSEQSSVDEDFSVIKAAADNSSTDLNSGTDAIDGENEDWERKPKLPYVTSLTPPELGPKAETVVMGGRHRLIIQGGEYGHFVQKQVNTVNVYRHKHSDASSEKMDSSLKPGVFRISSSISVLEEEPISKSSRVFRAILHSDVTGDKTIVVKITPADKKHQREAKIHFLVPHHKNVVERILTDTFQYRGQSSIYIAMELCDSNLYDHIMSQVANDIPFDSQTYLSITDQIVIGLKFLHSYKIVHGDLKPSNILLLMEKNIVVKLADFGLSRAISNDKTSTQLSSFQGGTRGWLAPEVLEGTTKVGFKTDIFPLGLVCHFAWSYGKHPYGDKAVSWNHYISEGTNQNLEKMLIPNAESAKVLLELMLQRNPADRPTAEQVLDHQIFASKGRNRPELMDDVRIEELVRSMEAMYRRGANEGSHLLDNGADLLMEERELAQHTMAPPTSWPSVHSLTGVCQRTPLCELKNNVVMMSWDETDHSLLPTLTSCQIFAGRSTKTDFVLCDHETNCAEIQHRLALMSECPYKINMVFLAHGWAVSLLHIVLEESNLANYLVKNGFSNEDCAISRVKTIRKNLAIFCLNPIKPVTPHLAKICKKLVLSNKPLEGDAGNTKSFFTDEPFYICLADFICSDQVMDYIRETLYEADENKSVECTHG